MRGIYEDKWKRLKVNLVLKSNLLMEQMASSRWNKDNLKKIFSKIDLISGYKGNKCIVIGGDYFK